MEDPVSRGTAELSELLALLTLSDVRVAEEVGVSAVTVRSWRTGRRSPSPENRSTVVRAAREHALRILRLTRELDADDAPREDSAYTFDDLRRLRMEAERSRSQAASIRRELVETARLLGQRG